MLQTDHARARILPDEGVPQDLGELAGSEWSVDLVSPQSPDALLKRGSGEKTGFWKILQPIFRHIEKLNQLTDGPSVPGGSC